jgi:hypothetical protein
VAAARLRRYSGALLIPLALTVTFAAFDWVMSLAPHWYSTISASTPSPAASWRESRS